MSVAHFVKPMQPNPDRHAAAAANLRLRADAVDEAGPRGGDIVRTFQHPSWQELHDAEQRMAGVVADIIAVAVEKQRGTPLTNREADALEQAANYLLRRMNPAFVRAAHEQAVETLLICDEFRAMARGRQPAEQRLIAHRLVAASRAAFHGVLEATVPLAPAVYLRCCAAALDPEAK